MSSHDVPVPEDIPPINNPDPRPGDDKPKAPPSDDEPGRRYIPIELPAREHHAPERVE